MKFRFGFVSNSSSMSFIVSDQHYPTVFDIAITMLKIQITEKIDSTKEWSVRHRHFLNGLIRRLRFLKKRGFDPNTPVIIPSTNFDTYIVKKDNMYYIDTSNNHSMWDDIWGIVRYLDVYNGETAIPDKDSIYFYDVINDIMIKPISYNDERCKNVCDDKTHRSLYTVILEDGKIVCLKCHSDKLQKYKITERYRKKPLLSIDELKSMFNKDDDFIEDLPMIHNLLKKNYEVLYRLKDKNSKKK